MRNKSHQETLIFRTIIICCIFVGLLCILGCGYGHAAFSEDLYISGEASVKATVGLGGYMQDLTPEICGDVEIGTTGQMIDKRDNKTYWVTKFKDGNCWMVQNLALTLSTSGTLNSNTTAITSTWRPTANSATSVTSSNIDKSYSGVRSYNFNNYIIANPTSNTSCGYIKSSPADCPTQAISVGTRKPSSDPNFYANNGNATYTATEYDAHYLVGVYYQYNAATAGTGSGLTGTVNATGSICPKNWILPIRTGTGSYTSLKSAEGFANNALFLPPYYHIRSGYIRPDSNFYLSVFGNEGSLMTSSNYSSSKAYHVNLSSGGTVTQERTYAYPVRCLVVGK